MQPLSFAATLRATSWRDLAGWGLASLLIVSIAKAFAPDAARPFLRSLGLALPLLLLAAKDISPGRGAATATPGTKAPSNTGSIVLRGLLWGLGVLLLLVAVAMIVRTINLRQRSRRNRQYNYRYRTGTRRRK